MTTDHVTQMLTIFKDKLKNAMTHRERLAISAQFLEYYYSVKEELDYKTNGYAFEYQINYSIDVMHGKLLDRLELMLRKDL